MIRIQKKETNKKKWTKSPIGDGKSPPLNVQLGGAAGAFLRD